MGGNLKQGEIHHGLRGDGRPWLEVSSAQFLSFKIFKVMIMLDEDAHSGKWKTFSRRPRIIEKCNSCKEVELMKVHVTLA